MSGTETRAPNGGERIDINDISEALTRTSFTYADGATQVFTRDGQTTYSEHGRSTVGTWGVDDHGQFWSFWPPSYRATYDLFWIAEPDGNIVGVRFTELDSGVTSEGRYAPELTSEEG